jgi:hypothetical protein
MAKKMNLKWKGFFEPKHPESVRLRRNLRDDLEME